MLKTDFPFSVQLGPRRLLAFVMGEPFLGFLAIVAVALTTLQALFTVSPAANALIETGQWTVIGIFALEYGVALVFAPSRRSFLVNPWRLVDLATIGIPLATLLPGVTQSLRSSPVLRLVRLVRIITLGMRASGIIVRNQTGRAANLAVGPVEISRVGESDKTGERSPVSWEDFLHWVRSPGSQWYNVSNVGREEARKIAMAAGVAPSFIEAHFLGATYPHLEVIDHRAALFVWVPEPTTGALTARNGVLLLVMGNSLLTLSRRPVPLLDWVAAVPLPTGIGKLPYGARMACVLLSIVMDRNEELVARLENELRTLEELPVRESRPEFFEQTFRLKKALSVAQADLWRLKGILSSLADGREVLPGGATGATDFFRGRADDAEYLYETIVNTREGLLSLIELHLNVVSFDMNRVMRVLAVVSVLGLIPSVIGGLFGMNLSDTPWPFTLPQVAFAVIFGMVLCLYLFFVKGWLR
jgi:Mg2+ and Co2+ transporter CorA